MPRHYLTALLLALALAATARAGIVDARGDFLSTYTGPHGGDLDVLAASADLDPALQVLHLHARMAARIGSTADPTLGGPLYVWGFDRGTGVAGFASIGIDNVFFDTVVVINSNGTGFIRLIPEAVTIALDPADIEIDGHIMRARFDLALLPTRGLDPLNYTWNLWPRLGAGDNSLISDFAPDNSNAALSVAVPEPSGLLLAGLGVTSLLLGRTFLRRRPT